MHCFWWYIWFCWLQELEFRDPPSNINIFVLTINEHYEGLNLNAALYALCEHERLREKELSVLITEVIISSVLTIVFTLMILIVMADS